MKKTARQVLAFLVIFVLVLTLVACGGNTNTNGSGSNGNSNSSSSNSGGQGSATDDDGPYRFALIAPLTGNNAQYGLAYQRAIELLVEQVNDAGGINGQEVVVDIYDDKNDATEAVTIANSVVEQADILGAVGSQTSTPSMAIAPLFQSAGIPLVSPNASHTDFAATGDYIFRTTYMTSATSSAVADNCYTVFKDEIDEFKVGIIYMQTDWGLSFDDFFTKQIESYGGSVLVSEPYVVEQTNDFTPLLTKIKNAGCNVLVLGTNYSEGGQIVKQAAKLNMDVKICASTQMFQQEFIDICGEDGEGILVNTMFNKDNPSETYQTMKAAYIEKYGSDEDLNEYVVKAYDAMKLLIEGAQAAGKDRAGIRDYIAAIENWEGATTTISMDEEGNPSGPVFISIIENGEFVFQN